MGMAANVGLFISTLLKIANSCWILGTNSDKHRTMLKWQSWLTLISAAMVSCFAGGVKELTRTGEFFPGRGPVAQPANLPVAESGAQSGAPTRAKPVAQPGAEPVAEPGAQPGAEPGVQPGAESRLIVDWLIDQFTALVHSVCLMIFRWKQ